MSRNSAYVITFSHRTPLTFRVMYILFNDVFNMCIGTQALSLSIRRICRTGLLMKYVGHVLSAYRVESNEKYPIGLFDGLSPLQLRSTTTSDVIKLIEDALSQVSFNLLFSPSTWSPYSQSGSWKVGGTVRRRPCAWKAMGILVKTLILPDVSMPS